MGGDRVVEEVRRELGAFDTCVPSQDHGLMEVDKRGIELAAREEHA